MSCHCERTPVLVPAAVVMVVRIVLAFRAACVRGLGVRIYLARAEAEAGQQYSLRTRKQSKKVV
jgi:hypothetical protein